MKYGNFLKPFYMLWSWLYGSWIYNTLSQLTLWVQLTLRGGVLDTTLCDEVFQW